jgi:polysaccharide deacetylase family protein (PEP-CTERM system associated)
VLIETGHSYDASVFPIHHDRYGIPDALPRTNVIERAAGTIIEVPASTVRVAGTNVPIAGGGYFRVFPYAFTKWGIQRVNAGGDPAIFYIHPWEIDADQPRLPVGWLTSLRHYSNLGDTLNRLERLVGDFQFDTVTATLESQTREAVPGVARWAHAK